MCFFFNDTATTEIYTLSLHRRSSDLLAEELPDRRGLDRGARDVDVPDVVVGEPGDVHGPVAFAAQDRKSTRLNSSHANISYAVFCLKNNHIPTAATPSAPPSPFLLSA